MIQIIDPVDCLRNTVLIVAFEYDDKLAFGRFGINFGAGKLGNLIFHQIQLLRPCLHDHTGNVYFGWFHYQCLLQL